MPTTQLTPVGVGWGKYPVAWLVSYNGADCELWRLVYEKCMEAGLCRELVKMFINELRKHKCFVEDLEDLDVITPRPPSASKPTTTTQNNHPSQPLKAQAP